MNINTTEVKSHIKNYYSTGSAWREGFKSTKSMSFTSRIINYLKKKELNLVLGYLQSLLWSNGQQVQILDAGCGNGMYSLLLAQHYPQARVSALDFSASMCDAVKKRAQEKKLKNLGVIQGDIDNLPFDDNSIDMVLCIDTLHHVPNEALAHTLTELHRVIKPGGLLLVDFKNKHNPYVYYSHQKGNKVTYYRVNRTFHEMKSFLNHAGLKVRSAKGVGFPWKNIAPYVVVVSDKK